MAVNTTTHKDRLKEITDSIEQGIKDLFQSDKYMEYLRTMSRFHRYSLNNTLLIAMQKPDATLVAGFNKWRDQFERNVRRGEKGIKIIAPTPFKKKIGQEKRDPDTQAPVLNPDGSIVMEEKEIKIPMYKVVSVFDVSQTEGKPLPQLASNLTGNVRQYEVFMEALRRSSPVPMDFERITDNSDGYFSLTDQRIAIREGMSEVQTVSAAIHEIAHSKLHNREQAQITTTQGDEATEPLGPKDRRTEEVEAESISFAVCAYYGISTGENSFGYIASWSKDKELPELRASLETINQTASGFISDIDSHFTEIAKERGIDLSTPEQQPVPSEPDILYQMHSNPRSEGENDRSFIQAYTRIDGELIPGEVIGVGTAELCIDLTNKLNSRDILPEQAKTALEEQPVSADAYPMPDPMLTLADRDAYGYTENDMLPLSLDRAFELYEKDITIYMLYEGNGAGMAFDRDDIDGHTGMFGVNREEWESSQEYLSLIEGHEVTRQELENNFLYNPSDAFAIYQLKHTEETRDIRFETLERLQAVGLTVERDNYEVVYTDGFTKFEGTRDRLEDLFDRFNNDRPEDFHGHSLSVSDIIALKQRGKVSYHYVDRFDFAELPNFARPENYLKNAEMAMEDDYGMIDGIVNNGPKQPSVAELEQQAKSGQPISLMDLAAATHRERDSDRKETRTSVLEQLKMPPAKPERHKTAPAKGAEMER